MKTPENRVKDKVRAYLKQKGAYQFSPVQMGLGASTLDILCCVKGKFVGIEVKAEGKKLTARQSLTMGEIFAAGGIAIWGDSAEKIINALMDYD